MGYSSSFFEQNTGATTDQALTTGMTCLWEGRTSRQGGVAYEYRTAAWRRGPVFRIYMLNSYSVSSSALCAIAHWSGRSSIPEIAVLEPTGLWNTGFPACAGNDSGEDVKPHSRGAFSRPSFAKRCPSEKRGRRECRALAAPAASWAEKGRRPTSKFTTGKAERSALPAQWLYGLLRALPGVSGLLAPVACGSPANLTPASR